MDEKILKRAAAWIYKNRNTGYWTYPLLVAEMSDRPEIRRLSLSPDDASAVFAALEKKGILSQLDGETLTIGQSSFQKYRIEYLVLRELKRFSEIPWYYCLPESWLYYVERYWAWFVVCVAFIKIPKSQHGAGNKPHYDFLDRGVLYGKKFDVVDEDGDLTIYHPETHFLPQYQSFVIRVV
jgi:hypothetical protein